MTLPPYPGWDSLHPLVVHFPIALLLVAPLLILVGCFTRRHERAWWGAALLLMFLGTTAAWVAAATGMAAQGLVDKTPKMAEVMAQHAQLAGQTKLVFTVLTIAFAALLFVPAKLKREGTPKLRIGVALAFMVVYGGCTLLVANTAHLGGRLVHQYGVQAMISG